MKATKYYLPCPLIVMVFPVAHSDSIDKQNALRRDWAYTIEIILEIRVSGVY